jgi:pimeloyl-ACP methyl ester carboxylesterase
MPAADVAVDADVQTLGMDSLMVVEVAQAVKQDLRLTLYPRELYEHPTIDSLAAYLAVELGTAQPVPRPTAAGDEDGSAPAAGTTGAARPAPPASPPDVVFLLSGPRSGSTLLRVMLAGHPRLFCPPELHLLPFDTLADQRRELGQSYLHEGLQRALMDLQGCDAEASKAILDGWLAEGLPVQRAYARLRHLAAPRLLVDKSPTYAGSIETLRRAEALFDSPRYLCLVRHPYAAIESFTRTRMHRLIGAEEEDPLDVAEQVWVQTNQNMLDFLREVDPGRQLLVRYEDLVRRPEETAETICTFLGIPPDPAVLRPYEGQRMTDGVHDRSLAIGDPNFLDHDRIEPELADAWKGVTLPRPLGPAARRLAATLAYPLPELERETPASGPAEARENCVTVNGLRLAVNAWGPEDGPAVVCLHGILDHGLVWEAVAAPLAAGGYLFVAPDQRGHGRSGHAAPGAYQVLNYVADLDALLAEVAAPDRPVVLVGHSMGAAVAATFASLRPDRVGALVLIEGLMTAEPPAEQFANLLDARLRYLTSTSTHPVLPDVEAAARRLVQAVPSLSPGQASRMAPRVTRPCDGGVCWSWDPALLTRADLTYDTLSITPDRYRALLNRISAPVTLVYGRADDQNLARMREALPVAAVQVVPGGHHLHLDAPAAVAEAIANSAGRAGIVPTAEPRRA